MQSVIVIVMSLGVALAAPGAILAPGAPLAYSAVAPGFTSSQYHAQDELGQYSYGYSGGPSSKQETKTADGITRGGYSYLDANGLVQSVNYVSDPVNGFRVAATNLPVGPSGAAVVAAPLAAAPVAYAAPAVAAAPAAYAAPLAYAAAPVHVAHAPGSLHVAQLPQPVADTPEVAVAKAQHFAAHAEASLRG